MVHTFEEIRTCTPATDNEAAPEATMPQVQGVLPPHTPETLRRWPQTTQPQACAIGAPQASPPTPPPPHPEEKGQGQGKGK